jgi:hypothetical protein
MYHWCAAQLGGGVALAASMTGFAFSVSSATVMSSLDMDSSIMWRWVVVA